MPQQQAPWLEGKYGWNFGEGGWNTGMDQNLLKFSFMFDRNVDSIVASLPAAVNGQAHYLTTDNRLYFAVGTTYFSTPVPKWFIIVERSTGQTYQYNGTTLVQVDSPAQLDTRLDDVELTVASLGTAAFEDIEFFTTQAELDIAVANSAEYTDSLRDDVADTTLTSKGSGQVGFNPSLTYPTNTAGSRFNDISNTVDDEKGAALVGFINQTVYSRLREKISIYDFFIPGQLNWDTAFANAVTYLSGFPGVPPELVFPSGVFEYSVSPNWAIQFAKISGSGGTRLRYIGTGNGFIVDGDGFVAMNGVFWMNINNLIYEGPSNSLNGFYFRSTHHCTFENLRVDGCGISSAAFDVNFAVVTRFIKPESSINSAGDGTLGAWYEGVDTIPAKPAYGMRLNQRGSGEQVAYCQIDNPIMEGVDIGISGVAMLGTAINYGTLEACTNVGLSLGVGCLRNVFNHIDFEVNVNADFFNSGAENKFIDIDSDSSCVINDGEYSQVIGGTFKSLTISAGADGTLVDRIVFNRANDGGVLTDNGVGTTKKNIRNAFSAYIHDAAPANVGITVGASPFSYTNTTGNAIHVYTIGGTVTQIARTRFGLGANSTGATSGETYLAPGDTITVTYSVAPVMLSTTS